MTIQFNYNNVIGQIYVSDGCDTFVRHGFTGAAAWTLRGGLRTVVESMLRAHGVAS